MEGHSTVEKCERSFGINASAHLGLGYAQNAHGG